MSKAKMMYAFDHIPAGGVANMATYGSDFPFAGMAMTGTTLTGSGGGTGGAATITASGGSNWLFGVDQGVGSGVHYYSTWKLPFSVFDLTKPRSWLGCRVKFTGTSLEALTWCSSSTGYKASLLATADKAWVVGQEYYVEIMMDWVAFTRTVWVDGQLVVNGASLGQSAAPLNTDIILLGGQSTTNGYTPLYVKDIYVMDDPADGSVSRLGPIIAKPITLASATGNGWVGNAYTGTLSGSMAISAAQSKFGGTSLFPGATATSLCSFPDAPGLRTGATGDSTYEAWVYNTSGGQTGVVFGKDNAVANSAHLTYANGSWQVLFDSSTVAINVAANMPLNAWVHMALVRYNGVWSLYQNGVLLAQYTGGTFGNNSYPFIMGNWGGANAPWQGYIDEGRVSNIARYTGPFTPPIAPFVPDANTMGLFHFNDSVGGLTADSSASAVQQLNTAVAATNSSIPNVTSAQDGTPLVMGIQSSADAGATIQGVLLLTSGQRAVATGTTLRATVSDQAVPPNQVQSNPIQFPSGSFGYGKVLGFMANAPDGSTLTTEKVAQLKLSAVASAT